MKLSKHIFWAPFVVGGLFGCGRKLTSPTYLALSPVPNDGANNRSQNPPDTGFSPARAPCDVWNSLPAPGDGATTFRILEEFKVQVGSGSGGSSVYQMLGRHNVGHLPQLRYALSTEYNGGKSPLDPPTIDQFMKLAADKHNKGQLSSTDYYMLVALYDLSKISGSAKSKLLDTRNGAVMDAVEAQLPGVFRAKLGSLDGDALITDLKHTAGLPDTLDPTQMGRVQLLTRAVSLFPSDDWNDRRLDLQASLGTLAATADRKDLSLDDRICRFALAQRVTAQLLTLKGLHGAPATQQNGLLADIPHKDEAVFPTTEEMGAYGVVADEPWITGQLAQTTARLAGAATSDGFLASFRYLVELTGHRDPSLWQLANDDGSLKNPEPGTLRLNPQLLKMAIGFFGMSGHTFQNEELQMDANQRISLRQDSADNVAALGSLSMEIVDAFSSLSTPNQLETQLLTPEQIRSFTDPYPVGVVPSFDMLINGVVFEGLARLSEGRGSDQLKVVLRQIGWRIGNDHLKNIP